MRYSHIPFLSSSPLLWPHSFLPAHLPLPLGKAGFGSKSPFLFHLAALALNSLYFGGLWSADCQDFPSQWLREGSVLTQNLDQLLPTPFTCLGQDMAFQSRKGVTQNSGLGVVGEQSLV